MTDPNKVTVEGSLARFLFRAKEGDFVIAILRTTDFDSVTIKGDLPGARLGAFYKVHGTSATDSYGGHVKIEAIEVTPPSTTSAVRAHLESFPGVGPATAAAIVEAFGVDAIKAIRTKTTAEIRAVAKRLTAEQVDHMRAVLDLEAQSFQTRFWVRTFLGEHATDRRIKAVVDEWGDLAPAKLTENPWALAEIPGIGFLTADAVAQASGKDRRSSERIQAGIEHSAEQKRDGGDTTFDERELIEVARNTLGFGFEEEPAIQAEVEALVACGRMSRENAGLLQLAKDQRNEALIARTMVERCARPGQAKTPMPEVMANLAEDQQRALEQVLQHGTFVLTGAPGVGKTHCVKAVIAHYRPSRVALCAPTGKAAKVLSAMVGQPASTIHRLLEPMPRQTKKGGVAFSFGRDESRPIDADLVVVDEASMVDASLFATLLRAIKPTTDLLIVGDHHQLASVGPGCVLRDLLECDAVPSAELTTVKRQKPGLIVQQCHAIKNGAPICPLPRSKDQDMVWMERGDVEVIAKEIVALYMDRLRKMPFTQDRPIESIQVLVPLREKGAASSQAINAAIQEARLAAGETESLGLQFNVGDKVLQGKNDYERGIVNGDLGVVTAIVGQGGHAAYEVAFEGIPTPVTVPRSGNSLQLAYAVTVHKSQGSQWPLVVVPVHPSFGFFFDRRLLYTAISRAQNLCVLIGTEANVPTVVRRTRSGERRTSLKQAIEAELARRRLPAVPGADAAPRVEGARLPGVAVSEDQDQVETIPF